MRLLHWLHTLSFLVLLITGIIQYFPGLSELFEGSWTHQLHRAGALAFAGVPALFIIFRFRDFIRGLRWAFVWKKSDLAWLAAAPRYYLLGKAEDMPPQGKLNAGQKIWWLLALVIGITFIGTGAVMEFWLLDVSPGLLNRLVALHDVCFVSAGVLFLGHVYLALFHPLTRGALSSMVNGRIPAEYARHHNSAWYDEVSGRSG